MSNPEVLLINNKQYLGNQGAIRLLTEKFERTESSVWNAIAQVCQFLFEYQSSFIKWSIESEMPYIASKFKGKCGFPVVVGVIDGCHIPFYPSLADQKPSQLTQSQTKYVPSTSCWTKCNVPEMTRFSMFWSLGRSSDASMSVLGIQILCLVSTNSIRLRTDKWHR